MSKILIQAARKVWEEGGKTNAPNGAVMRTSALVSTLQDVI